MLCPSFALYGFKITHFPYTDSFRDFKISLSYYTLFFSLKKRRQQGDVQESLCLSICHSVYSSVYPFVNSVYIFCVNFVSVFTEHVEGRQPARGCWGTVAGGCILSVSYLYHCPTCGDHSQASHQCKSLYKPQRIVSDHHVKCTSTFT